MLKLLIIGLFAVGLCIAFPLAFAQEAEPLLPLASPSPVEYALPYPGILPDHPLYFLKQIRDNILLLLISHPIRKVEFYILLADKHLNMGIALLEKNKAELAIQTVEKGFSYLKETEKLIFAVPVAGSSEVANNKHRFEKSLLKHKEVVLEMGTSMVDDEQKQRLSTLVGNMDSLYQEFLLKK